MFHLSINIDLSKESMQKISLKMSMQEISKIGRWEKAHNNYQQNKNYLMKS